MRQRVLIVEDERVLAEVLADNLREEGLEVTVARDGESALRLWQCFQPDLVILDVMLPRLSGLDVCRRMRTQGDRTPVLFLSAKGQPEERVEGLRAGGDDYMGKPFHLPELLLRVQNMLSRLQWGREEVTPAELSFGGHQVDFRTWNATLADGRVEPLGEREIGILKLFAERAGEVVSRDEILDRVWGGDIFPSSRTVDNFIVRLRKLFEPDPAHPIYLHTVWGVGYRFTPEGAGSQSPHKPAQESA
ncbi:MULTISPECIES: response regulator transcription factor [unclassified Meiothermus]|uniref:response regulator transcription factor n=1 Tax=unclassified Meiothermus TaxID=370471 RepID=UPI000D7D0FD0|nr:MULTISPECIES: response regulator transcription factor [unclassified Meiothermus]PZA07061.1 DNA-binding response regulator [Meiothermus sp. Pnk-1]RYM40063.1 response regulator transcription factor [Meiothermus sp. PNK-Is4]